MPLNSYRLQQTVIFLLLLAISSAAWTYMLLKHHHSISMASMHHSLMMSGSHTWSIMDFTNTFAVWAVMMIAMMTPSVVPMVLRFSQIRRLRTIRGHPYFGSVAFVLGYFLIWLAFCALGPPRNGSCRRLLSSPP